jgi:Rieske Fe-S protein
MNDRRHFVRCAACGIVGLAAMAIPGCGGETPAEPTGEVPTDSTKKPRTDTTKTTGTGDPKFEVAGSTVRIFLARVPELASVPGFFLIDTAQTIVIRTAESDYSAFTAVCTHEGCLVSTFSGGQMVCPCHGSVYNLQGSVVSGPAPSPLVRYSTSLDTTKSELLVTKTA